MDTCSHGHRNDSPEVACAECAAAARTTQQGSGSRTWRRGAVAAGVAALIAAAAAPALFMGSDDGKDPAPDTAPAAARAEGPDRTIEGTFVLIDPAAVEGGLDSCAGNGAFDDVRAGLEVNVRNGEGTIVGVTAVRNMTRQEAVGYLIDQGLDEMFGADEGGICPLAFTVEVADAAEYDIEIGSRATISSTAERLEQDQWKVGFALGL